MKIFVEHSLVSMLLPKAVDQGVTVIPERPACWRCRHSTRFSRGWISNACCCSTSTAFPKSMPSWACESFSHLTTMAVESIHLRLLQLLEAHLLATKAPHPPAATDLLGPTRSKSIVFLGPTTPFCLRWQGTPMTIQIWRAYFCRQPRFRTRMQSIFNNLQPEQGQASNVHHKSLICEIQFEIVRRILLPIPSLQESPQEGAVGLS
mmetsp:Transcript_131385/g.252963  ORF Transcript_131385/g.252963 Transcript_131385/m.252963 type:complete len:206 (-) Transcript_131385:1326-1943(-)